MSKGVVKRSFTIGGVRFPVKCWPMVNIGGVDFNLETGEMRADPKEHQFGSAVGINQESGMREGYSGEEWMRMKKERNQ